LPMDEMKEEQSGWYEASLSLQERRNRGHFSTPPLLVEHILDACGYTPESHLRSLRVLDPACGSGNFLAATARRLVSFAAHSRLPRQELAALVQHNLWGFDPDPVSCFLAEMQLSAALATAMAGVDEVLSATTTPFHIHQADGLALPWQEPCVDLYLANPPYLAAKNTDLSAYRTPHQRGQADSYLLFLSLGLRLVRPGGWLGLVLPDPLLARTNASRERTRLLEEFTLHHLWHLSDVFTAQVGAVVIIAQKCPPTTRHHVAWKREKWQHGPQNASEAHILAANEQGESQRNPTARTVPQSLFLRQPRAELRYLLSNEYGATIERLQAHINNAPAPTSGFAPLGHYLAISRGEELGMKSPYLIREKTVNSPGQGRDAYCCGTSWYPVLRGGKDLRPYQAPHSAWWIARDAISKPLERYLAAKLLVVKSMNRLQATLDVQGHVALQTLYLLHLRERDAHVDDLYFYLALLNSRLLRQYVYVLHTAYKWIQPQIEQIVLARLPVPIVTEHEKKEVIACAKLLVHACSAPSTVVEWNEDMQDLYEEQERALSALYNALIC
jgi:SAM-dependent methyltransferase